MSDQKTNWVAGDEITSSALNLIGEGINTNTNDVAELRTVTESLSQQIQNLDFTQDNSGLEDRISAVENDYVSKTSLADGFKAQSAYNVVTYKYTKDDGSYSQIWNEASGGGAQVYDKTSDIIAFLGVNVGRGDNDIWGQFYAKAKATNIGTRMNYTNHGVYMTIDKANGSYTEDDLLQTKAMTIQTIKDFLATDEGKNLIKSAGLVLNS